MKNGPKRCNGSPFWLERTPLLLPQTPRWDSSFCVTLAELKLHFILGDTDLIHL